MRTNLSCCLGPHEASGLQGLTIMTFRCSLGCSCSQVTLFNKPHDRLTSSCLALLPLPHGMDSYNVTHLLSSSEAHLTVGQSRQDRSRQLPITSPSFSKSCRRLIRRTPLPRSHPTSFKRKTCRVDQGKLARPGQGCCRLHALSVYLLTASGQQTPSLIAVGQLQLPLEVFGNEFRGARKSSPECRQPFQKFQLQAMSVARHCIR